MYKTKKSRIPAVYRILLVAIAVMAIGGIAVNCYVGNYYRADSIAEAAIDSDREVSVTIEKKDKRIQATQYDLKLKNYPTIYNKSGATLTKDSTVTVTNTGGGTAIYNAS